MIQSLMVPGLGAAYAKFSLEGEFATDFFQPTGARLVANDGSTLLTFAVPPAVRIPAWAIDSSTQPAALSETEARTHLAALSSQLRQRAQASLLDAVRRLETVHIRWTGAKNFFGASIEATGEVKVFLSQWLLDKQAQPEALLAEFSLRCSLQAGNLATTYALTVLLRGGEVPKLRLDYDDFNFSFPEIEFPELNLSMPWKGAVPNGNGASRLLGRLGALVGQFADVTCTDPNKPVLVVDMSTSKVNCALVKPNEDPIHWEDLGKLAGQLATFEVKFSGSSGKDASIQGIQLAFVDDKFIAKGTFVAGVEVLAVPDRSGRLGPFDYRFKNLRVRLEGSASSTDRALLARVTFERLRISLADDPQTALAFEGEVELTPSGARIVSLKLWEPNELQLLQAAANALARGARGIAVLAALLPSIDSAMLERLFEILGKFAAAVARQAYIVGNAIANAAEEAGRVIGSMLDAIGEGIKVLLQKLRELAPSGASADLEVQVTLSLDPIEILQIIVLRKSANTSIHKASAAGFELTLQPGWRPGVLVDLSANPGAYLIAAWDGSGTGSTPMATLGTDLWLAADDSSVSQVADADPTTGNRADDRLIQVTVKHTDASQKLIAVVAGVCRGQGVFLKKLPAPTTGSGGVLVADWTSDFEDLGKALKVSVDVKPKRLLPLLGMGETGDSAAGSQNGFLEKLQKGVGQVVWVESFDGGDLAVDDECSVTGALKLGVKAAGVSSIVDLGMKLSLKTLHASFTGPSGLSLKSARIEEEALGLTWVVEQANEAKRKKNEEVPMFKLSFSGGESGFELDTEHARMELRFGGLSKDGEGVVFKVSKFRVGRRGVDISAAVDNRAVRLNGLDVPFQFKSGAFEMRASRLMEASIAGRGTLPPALIGEADCTLALAFAQGENGIELQSGKVEIDKKGEPIVCHSTRFTLTITDLDVGIQKDDGYHFYFLVTGSLRFKPKAGEFENGLLQYLKDIEINLERAPLTGDARVLAKHISFQKSLNPKKTFNLFNLFTFELRGFGFHPASPRFGGKPAINLSGQIKFAEVGDVMQPSIDFHGLWIAPPKQGEALPRISAEGLGLDLQLSGSVKIRGSVLAVDPSTRTVEGKEFAPEGYNTYGFLGEGEVDIPGWGCMQASLGFLEIEKKDTGERKKAFFVYLQRDKLAVQIPTGFWTFYMREAGFGFGFRYTLAGIRDADTATSPAQLIRVLDDVSKRQGDLARYAAWSPDPEDRFTLALRAAVQAYPAEQVYDQTTEETVENPFFFDVIVALRSDLTLLASMRGYLGVNYADFRANKENFRERPGLRGYLYVSAPRSELLARMIADSKGFIGERFPGLQKGQILRRAVESVDWTSTLYIRPGLFHFEMGWPDQLSVRLVDTDNMKVSLRGGMIFRAAEDGLLWGYNIEADAWLRFGGSVGSSIGVAVEASMQARFIARLIAYLSWRFQGSLVYGLVSLDATLAFSVRAWMKVNLRFTSFTIRIGFSVSVQFSAAIELAIGTNGVGARAQARIAVSAFGCTLGVFVGFSFNDGALESARARVQRFMAMSITAEEPDAPPKLGSQQADQRADQEAIRRDEEAKTPENQATQPTVDPEGDHSSISYPPGTGREIGPTNFWMTLHADPQPRGVGDQEAYALLVPMEAEDEAEGGFYCAPMRFGGPQLPSHTLHVGAMDAALLAQIVVLEADGTSWRPLQVGANWMRTYWEAKVGTESFTLGDLVDQCFLTNIDWLEDGQGNASQVSFGWQEPQDWRVSQRKHQRSEGSDQERTLKRDELQKNNSTIAASRPADERAYQGRSTVLTMLLDQFVSLASQGRRPGTEAHVLDLGLILRGPAEALEALAKVLTVEKADCRHKKGTVTLLNPPSSWFVRQDPVFALPRSEVGPTGPRLSWDLSLPWMSRPHEIAVAARSAEIDPDNFLLHYEIVRTVEGREFTPHCMRIKPASTMGGTRSGQQIDIELLKPDWQFTDDLIDLGEQWRRALVPPRNEHEAVQAAIAWMNLQLGADITITYTITPVDTAGTAGLARSFALTIDKPRPAVRPAQVEIRVVQDVENMQPWQAETSAPKDLQVFIGLSDLAWKADEQLKIDGATFDVKREYRLYVEEENVLPAGSFGSDGLTDRLRGLTSANAIAKAMDRAVADEARGGERQTFAFARARLVDATATDGTNEFVRAIQGYVEGDAASRKRLPLWTLLSGAKIGSVAPVDDSLLRQLWGRSQSRIACRFWVRTELAFYRNGSTKAEYRLASIPVEAPSSLSLRNVPASRNPQLKSTRAVVQPQAFEWPVDLQIPPLPPGQVRVQAGFLHVIAPLAEATLGQWGEQADSAVTMLRDADRRTLTVLEFDAVPAFDAAAVKPLHLSAIAGYEVHALDLDELAPSDSEPVELSKDLKAWKRARRVAHVKLVSDEAAALTPPTNADWLGWHATYPSETWRTSRVPSPAKTASAIPIRKGWYSASESLPLFAKRQPRLRLLPHAVDSFVDELLIAGQPKFVAARLTAAVGTPARKTLGEGIEGLEVRTQPLSVAAHEELWLGVRPGLFALIPTKGEPAPVFTASRLRYLLLSLCRPRFSDEVLKTWQDDPHALDGLTLVIEAKSTPETSLASVTVPLTFNVPLHGILEETIAELAWAKRDGGNDAVPRLYRRYAVSVQAPPAVDSRELGKYLASSPAATDPYGWGVLQGLGLAATLRIFDLASARYIDPKQLAGQANRVFSDVVRRWQEEAVRDGQSPVEVTGQAFAEVLMRPGANRVARPFDGLADRAEDAFVIDVDSRALAMLQLSLRPAPDLRWQYVAVTLRATAVGAVGSRIRQLALEVSSSQGDALDISIAGQGAVAHLDGWHGDDAPTSCTLTVVLQPGLERKPMDAAEIVPALTVIVRRTCVENGLDGVTLTYVADTEVPKKTDSVQRPVEIQQVRVIPDRVSEPLTIRTPTATLPAGLPNPFGRFDAQSSDVWAAAAASGAAAIAALQSNLKAIAPDLTFPSSEAQWKSVMPQYLEWMRRLLDHAAVPLEPQAAATQLPSANISLAIAAPTKLSPCELAADSTGCLKVSIPGDDKLAHARAYAVRPVSRYAHLLAGAGHGLLEDAERLLDPAATTAPEQGVGYAVAAVPRTERVEPPMILGSSVIDGNWEVIVGRHAEESMAHSNRPLFARLGKPAVLISQLRTYRSPSWPERVARQYPSVGSYELYPERLASGLPQRPEWEPLDAQPRQGRLLRLSEGRLATLSENYPGLWKGAEVFAFTTPPPQYRMAALAVARGGISLSNITSVLQDDFPRAPMSEVNTGDGGHPGPTLRVERVNGDPAMLVLTHRLVSHHDLTPDAARSWETGGENDVAWWPDPDVIYNIVHRADSQGVQLDEELLETRLVAQAPKGDGVQDAGPVLLRARSKRWKPLSPQNAISVRRTSAGGRSTFELTVKCALDPQGPSGPSVSTTLLANDITDSGFAGFSQACQNFATCLIPKTRVFDLVRDGLSDDDYVAKIQTLRAVLPEQLKVVTKAGERYAYGELIAHMQRLIDTLEKWFTEHGSDPDVATQLDHAVAPGGFLAEYLVPAALLWPAAGFSIGPGLLQLQAASGDGLLLIHDVPTDVECTNVTGSGHPLALKDSRFWHLLVQRLTGGAAQVLLRATDARGEIPRQGVPTTAVGWLKVDWPAFVHTMVS